MTREAADTTLDSWLVGQDADAPLSATIAALAAAAEQIAGAVRAAPLNGHIGSHDAVNVQGEEQKTLDVISNDIMVAALGACADVAAMVSEEVPDVIGNDRANGDARLAVCFDPLDGSSNIATNGTIGSIFSVLRLDGGTSEADVLDATGNQLAAGYVLYGPATLLVLTIGRSVAKFAVDPHSGGFLLVRDGITIPRTASEFAINMAHRRHWQAPVASYIEECVLGEEGPRGKPYNMRWMGAMVADVHRVLMNGGIFIYPALTTPGGASGKLRLLYEALPMAMLVETAGGRAVTGAQPVQQVSAESLHQRVPLALGSADEVAYLTGKYG